MLGSFVRHERGNVAVVFAAVLVPVIGVVAAGLDYGRASQARNQLQSASEAAAVAASHQLHLDRDQLFKVVRRHLDANLEGDLREVPFEVVVPSDKSFVEIAMQTRIPTSLLGLVGIPQIEVATTAHVARPSPKLPDLPLPPPGPPISVVPNGGFRELWRSLTGGNAPSMPAPDPAAIREAQEQVARALRDAAPNMPMPVDLGPIRNSEDLRRAAEQMNDQLRDLQRQMGTGGPQDLERIMRELRR